MGKRTGLKIADDGALPDGERKCLIATAQHSGGVTREQLSILTGYKRSTRDAYVQRLRGRGLVDDSKGVVLATSEGIAALGGDYEPLPTGRALLNHWLQRLPFGEAEVLKVVVGQYPNAADRELVSHETGFKRSTRDAYLQRLSARKLVSSVVGGVVASATLFD